MNIRIENVSVFRPDGHFTPGTVFVSGGKIVSDCADAQTVDGQGALVCPGLLDIHTHGRAGADFCSATEAQLGQMAADYARHGVTFVLPTLASDTLPNWEAALRRIARAALPAFGGVHLEGRWLAPGKRGAHAPELLAPPNAGEIDRLIHAASVPILRITAAPELDTDGSFLSACRRAGIRFSIGHTDADYATAISAFHAGANCFTHLYNAMPPLHHRAGGPVAAALTEPEAFAELICDGLHVSPEVVRLTFQAKGSRRLILISDSMAGTGCPDGPYGLAGQTAILKNGMALTPDGKLAGSTLNLLNGVQNLARFCGIPFGEALRCATVTPAAYLGLEQSYGTLEPGAAANLFLLPSENAPMPARVMQNGHWL